MSVLNEFSAVIFAGFIMVCGTAFGAQAQTVNWSAELVRPGQASESLSGDRGRFALNDDPFGAYPEWQEALPYPGRERPGPPFLTILLEMDFPEEPPTTGGAEALRAYMARVAAGDPRTAGGEIRISVPDIQPGATGRFDESVISVAVGPDTYVSKADIAAGQVIPGYQSTGLLRTADITILEHTATRLRGRFEARMLPPFVDEPTVERARGVFHVPEHEVRVSGEFSIEQSADAGEAGQAPGRAGAPAGSGGDADRDEAATGWADMVRDRDERLAAASASGGAIDRHQSGAGVLVLDGEMIELEVFGCQGAFLTGGPGNAGARGVNAAGQRVGVGLQAQGERGSLRAEGVSLNIGSDSYILERRFEGEPPRGEEYLFYLEDGMFMAEGAADQIRGPGQPEFMVEGSCPG